MIQANADRRDGAAFRQDINALRAFAVVAVVGFHLQLDGFEGGFSGVDSFFVITGYLMGWKVLNDLLFERFSFVSFWADRMRRIYPALAVTVIVTGCAGFFLTMPDQYLKNLLQSLSALTFVSNFTFSSDSGYFSAPAQTKVLLHTWSLSVEWQFYCWMPIIAAAIWYRTRSFSILASAFLAVTICSLSWCIWKSYSDATAAPFFSLRTRAWEPLAGCLLAALEIQYRAEAERSLAWLKCGSSAIVGWLILAVCTISPMPEAGWPGLFTVLPVAGTLLVLAAGRSWPVFELAPVRKLGEWSYSIYLWHWPIWVFVLSSSSLHGHNITLAGKCAIAAAAVAAGALSYSLIEQSFLRQRNVWTALALFNLSSAVFAALAIFTGTAFWLEGFPTRFPDYIQSAELARKTSTPRDECFRNQNSEKAAPETYCRFGDETSKPSLILWGDSLANQYLIPLTASARNHHLEGLIATQGACIVRLPVEAHDACDTFDQATLRFILADGGPGIVVLGSNWSRGDEAARVIDILLAARKIVIFIMPSLEIGFDVPARWIENQVRQGSAIPEWKIAATSALLKQPVREAIARNILDRHLGDAHLILVDPQLQVCGDGVCALVKDGKPNFRDAAHISNVTAMQYLPMFEAALDQATAVE